MSWPDDEMIDVMVLGVPCQAQVTHFVPVIPAKLSGDPDGWAEAEGGEVEYDLCWDGKPHEVLHKLADANCIWDEIDDQVWAEIHRHDYPVLSEP